MALKGSSNEEKIWNYLKSKGLCDYGCAGLMGNLFAESGLKPNNLQNSYEKKLGLSDDAYVSAVDKNTYTNFVRDSAGFGIAQWTYWSRKQKLLDYATQSHKSIGDLEMQLEFLVSELNGGYKSVMDVLKNAASVREASDAVLLKYERPANKGESAQIKRADYGKTYYAKYASVCNVATTTQSTTTEKENIMEGVVTMGKLDEFINLLEQEVQNHSIYVWGAQGHTHPTITESWIRARENSEENAERAIRFWKKQCAAGYQDRLKAFDCSGLGIWALQTLKLITFDTSAAGLYSKCKKISKNDLKRGDWVFNFNGTKISHIGYIVDDDLNTIEALGRDVGVVKRKLSQGKWSRFGRPPYFQDEIESHVSGSTSPSSASTSDTANSANVTVTGAPYVKVIGNRVNVRSAPNTAASILGIAKKDETYQVVDNDWHYIDFGGTAGWISGKNTLTQKNE